MIMEYQKIIYLFDDTKNQPSKFRTRNWVEKMMNRKGCMIIVTPDLKRPNKVKFM